MSLQESVNGFQEVRHYYPMWRAVGMLTEEAGEVSGAFNKWMDGNKRKPKTEDDVLLELVQLTGCCFLVADKLHVEVDAMLELAAKFLDDKRAQIIEDGWTPEDQEYILCRGGAGLSSALREQVSCVMHCSLQLSC